MRATWLMTWSDLFCLYDLRDVRRGGRTLAVCDDASNVADGASSRSPATAAAAAGNAQRCAVVGLKSLNRGIEPLIACVGGDGGGRKQGLAEIDARRWQALDGRILAFGEQRGFASCCLTFAHGFVKWLSWLF